MDAQETADLIVGEYYDFHASHTVYHNAKLKRKDDDGGVGIWWMGMAYVYLTSHELLNVTGPTRTT